MRFVTSDIQDTPQLLRPDIGLLASIATLTTAKFRSTQNCLFFGITGVWFGRRQRLCRGWKEVVLKIVWVPDTRRSRVPATDHAN